MSFVIDASPDRGLLEDADVMLSPKRLNRGVGAAKSWKPNKGKSRRRQQGPGEADDANADSTSESESDSDSSFELRRGLGEVVVLSDPVEPHAGPPISQRGPDKRQQVIVISSDEEEENEEDAIVRDFMENADPITGPGDLIKASSFSAVVGLDASDDSEDEDYQVYSDVDSDELNESAQPRTGAQSLSKAAAKKLRKANKKARLQAKRARLEDMNIQAQKFKNGLNQMGEKALHTLLIPINSEIKKFVSDPQMPEVGALPPMPQTLRRPALRLAEIYKLRTRTQGHGKSKYTVLYRTQQSAVPLDWNHLVEKVLKEPPSASEMSNSIPKRVAKADQRKGGSAAVRLDKDRPRSAAAGYEIGEKVGGAAAPISSGVGFKLMEKMGWSVGTGLGKVDEEAGAPGGILEPIAVTVLARRRGLGHYDSER